MASAEVAGNKNVVPQVIAELRANTDVEQAAGVAVGDAVKTLLTDDTVLSALDSTAAGVVTDLLADEAVSFVERNREKPFFLYLAFNAPHSPLQATEKYLSRFAGITDPKRRTYAAQVMEMDPAGYWRFEAIHDQVVGNEVVGGLRLQAAGSAAITSCGATRRATMIERFMGRSRLTSPPPHRSRRAG